MKIRLIDAHLFYEYFIRQSVRQATKQFFLKTLKCLATYECFHSCLILRIRRIFWRIAIPAYTYFLIKTFITQS